MQRALPILLVPFLCAMRADAQSIYVEIEPNDARATATPVVCLIAGDALTGTTIGAQTTPGPFSFDYFLVETCALPLGIYEHRLTLASTSPGHTSTIRGQGQSGAPGTGGTPNGLEQELQLNQTSPARAVVWYGFGKQERFHYRVAGTMATTAPYVSTLSTTQLVATPIGTFFPGSIRITTQGQGHSNDTDLCVYDATLTPVSTCINDDAYPVATGFESNLERTYAPGTYYLALTRYNLATDQPSAADDGYVLGYMTEFPDIAVQGVLSEAPGLAVDFAVTDSAGTVAVTASLNTSANSNEIRWFEFTVGIPIAFEPFCAGDGLDPDVSTPCPCANAGASGNGCANSTNAAGARLDASGGTNPDTIVLAGSGMPASVACIYLQGDGLDDAVFGDGVRCAGGTLIRLRTKVNAGGASQFPDGGDTVDVSTRGQVTPGSGARRYYQTYYRNAAAAFCPPETFNVTNGWVIDW